MTEKFFLKPVVHQESKRLIDCFQDFYQTQFQFIIQRWGYFDETVTLDHFFDWFKGKDPEESVFENATGQIIVDKFKETIKTWRLWELREEYFFKSKKPFGIRDLFRRERFRFDGYADHFLDEAPENYDSRVDPKVEELLNVVAPEYGKKNMEYYWGGSSGPGSFRTPVHTVKCTKDRIIGLYEKCADQDVLSRFAEFEQEKICKEIPTYLVLQNEKDMAEVENREAAESWRFNSARSIARLQWLSSWYHENNLNVGIHVIKNVSEKEITLIFIK